MRIISGTNKGKKLYAPEGKSVRPTGDKIKEAIFNIIGSIDEESTVLELFAGSGSIGIEFLARGAKHCTLVDISRKSLNYVKRIWNYVILAIKLKLYPLIMKKQ